jgi:hypothetical protein
MISAIRVPLYDIFGYLLPGFILLTALSVMYWTIFFRDTPLPSPQIIDEVSVVMWIVIAGVSYLFGHILQAIANMIMRQIERGVPQSEESMPEKVGATPARTSPDTKQPPKSPLSRFFARLRERRPLRAEDLVLGGCERDALPKSVVTSAKKKASLVLGVKAERISHDLLYQVCEEVVAQNGKTTDRDIYIYREGFYRGVFISLLFLTLALFVRAFFPGTAFEPLGKTHLLNPIILASFAVMSALAAYLSFQRYQRFGRYRVRQAVLGFLLLNAKSTEEKLSEVSSAALTPGAPDSSADDV